MSPSENAFLPLAPLAAHSFTLSSASAAPYTLHTWDVAEDSENGKRTRAQRPFPWDLGLGRLNAGA